MTDHYRWRRRAAFMLTGAVAVTLLWPCVALVRATTAHDWYAAVKLTVTEAMIAVGFNSFKPTRYRAADGTSYPHHARRAGPVRGTHRRARPHSLHGRRRRIAWRARRRTLHCAVYHAVESRSWLAEPPLEVAGAAAGPGTAGAHRIVGTVRHRRRLPANDAGVRGSRCGCCPRARPRG